MELLEFARGPVLTYSLAVFVLGTVWRLLGVLLLPIRRIPSRPREGTSARTEFYGALRGIVRRLWPYPAFRKAALFATLNGYVFHIGLAIVVFGFGPHILFIEEFIGLSWGNLPSNVIYAVGVLTVGSLIAALVHRLFNPPQRLISTFNDYFSWFVTIAPVVTGLLASAHLGARYETLLAVHILSVALLLVWFPFGKLMHAFLFPLARGATGIRMTHRGAQV